MFNNSSMWEFIFGGTHAHFFSYILIFMNIYIYIRLTEVGEKTQNYSWSKIAVLT